MKLKDNSIFLIQSEYNKNYATPEEEQLHFKIFADNWKAVQEHNKKFAAGEVTWEMGINQFSDLTPDEMKKHTGLLIPSDL